MNAPARRALILIAVILLIAPLRAADIKVDLSKEKVGEEPKVFQPIVGTWLVAQDGTDKVIMLDKSQWHELRMTVQGTDFKAWIDDQLALEYTLSEPVSGKVGLWSKTDSTSYFKDYVVSPRQQGGPNRRRGSRGEWRRAGS